MITTYNICDNCGRECTVIDCIIEQPVYEPWRGIGWEPANSLASKCCASSFTQRKTLPLTLRAKKSLLKRWNRIGNAEIINHIENVLPYIGEVYE